MAVPKRKRPAKHKKKPKPCPAGYERKTVTRVVTKRVKGRKVRVKQTTTPCVKKKAAPKPAPPAIVVPPPTTQTPPPPAPPAPTGDTRAMTRLCWRAGFGPRPGQVAALARMNAQDAVRAFTRPPATATLTGPAPHDDDGLALAPDDRWGHDHLFWLDRMVRSDQQLVERMALIWHDWFATSESGVGSQARMLAQIGLFRDHGLGSFKDLALAVTVDEAMLLWLNGVDNRRGAVNENYARELMELFTLGADRGAYTETDVRELARSLTGWRRDWSASLGDNNFRFDANRFDATSKTVFGQTGNWGWQDAVRLCVDHPAHPAFFVTKLWGYFVPGAPDAATQSRLEALYVSSGHSIRDVVEAILLDPVFTGGGGLVTPPVVFNAGLLRAVGRGIDTTAWVWLGSAAGQQLLWPPNVAGWDDSRWLDTSTARGRWELANYAIAPYRADPWPDAGQPVYDATETPDLALARALAFWGDPPLTADTRAALASFAATCLPTVMASWQQSPYRAMRQNALRMLIATAPDFQVS